MNAVTAIKLTPSLSASIVSRTAEICVVDITKDGKRQTLTYSSHTGRTGRVRWQFDSQSSSFAPIDLNTVQYDMIVALVEGDQRECLATINR